MIWVWLFLSCQFTWVTPGQGTYHVLSAKWFSVTMLRPNSYFGYSVTYEPTSKRLIASAPRGDDIGQIYWCDIDSKVCKAVPRNITRDNNPKIIKPSHTYWYGAVVKAGPSYFVTCAPLAVQDYHGTYMRNQVNRVRTFSRCYKYTSPSEPPIHLSSLNKEDREKDTTVFEQSMDSFGWSIDVADDNVIIGGPAMFTGRAIKYHDANIDPVSLTGIHSNWKVIAYNFGYSVVAGYFRQGVNSITYAVGSPYGQFGLGKIAFYTSFNNKLKMKGYLTGSDEYVVGSMFGAVLCAARFTPGAADTALVVGAPTYAAKDQYNVGAVYIYAARKSVPLNQLIRKIIGHQDGSYFGSAIVSVGDLNGDGRDEIAIGAPYEESGSGAVYLYSSAEIVSKKAQIGWMQRIVAEPNERPRAFGLSLATVQDYDENGCNELAIGAPESDKVMLVWCIASVKVTLKELIPDLRKYKNKVNPNRNDTHFKFESCLEVVYPEKPEVITAQIKVQIQISHPQAKLANSKDGEYSLFLNRRLAEVCRPVVVETPLNGNYNFPVTYNIKATQIEPPTATKEFEGSQVALTDTSKLNSSSSIWIAECNISSFCMPALKYLNATLSEKSPYIIGSKDIIYIDISIRNEGEVAYDPCLRIGVDNATIHRSLPECVLVNATSLMCTPKQVLHTNNTWTIHAIPLTVTHLTNEYDGSNITIPIAMYNHCTKNTSQWYTEGISLKADPKGISIKGVTDLGLDDMVNMTETEGADGKAFEHIYTVINSGPTNFKNVTAKLVLQKRHFIKNYTINLSNGGDKSWVGLADLFYAPSFCKLVSDDNDEATFDCTIEKIFTEHDIKIAVLMYIAPGVLRTVIENNENTVYTAVSLDFGGRIGTDSKYSSKVLSKLRLVEVIVNPWIIVLAAIFGIIILCIMFFILRECGFFRRDKKKNLEKVQQSVKRQTIMRKSMIEGCRVPPGPDQQALIHVKLSDQAAAAGVDRRLRLDETNY